MNWAHVMISSVQSLSRVRLFETPWTAARQASLFITNSQSLLKLMSIELVMSSSHLILCPSLLPQSFPASGSFPRSQFFASDGQGIGASASASVLPMNIQDWSPLGWTGWISLLSCILETGFYCGNGEHKVHFKGMDEEPLIRCHIPSMTCSNNMQSN